MAQSQGTVCQLNCTHRTMLLDVLGMSSDSYLTEYMLTVECGLLHSKVS